jgi:hypothetical protein
MININSILSGLPSVPGVAKPLKPVAESYQSVALAQGKDTFSQGEQWRNRVRSSESSQTGTNAVLLQVERAYEGQPYLAVSAPSPQQFQSPEEEPIETKPAEKSETGDQQEVGAESSGGSEQAEASPIGPTAPDGTPLTATDRQFLAQLQEADTKVKAHEMAHLAAAGGYATGGASFQYQQGPDGKKYAVGGEVPIDIGKEQTPEQTIAKMRIVRQAALAPADPSPQDQSVAARATLNISEASQELNINAASGEDPLKDAVSKRLGREVPNESSPFSEDGGKGIHVEFQNGPKQASPLFSGNGYTIGTPASGNSQSQSMFNLLA